MWLRQITIFALFCASGCSEVKAESVNEHMVGGKTVADVFSNQNLAMLARAACEGDIAKIGVALSGGANPNAVGLDGVTPLLWAGDCGNEKGVRALLQAGANPNPAGNGDGLTPLLAAVSYEDPAILRALLAAGADPNAAYKDSPWTALRMAFSYGISSNNWRNYYLLLDAGADINRIHAGETIAEFAVLLTQYDKAEELLHRGYNLRLDNLLKIAKSVKQNESDRGKIIDANKLIVELSRLQGSR